MKRMVDLVAPKLNLVVAACNTRGIGLDGQLPWRLRGDMQFFKTITSTTKQTDKQNAVIMGRKTWDSIPAKFKPLHGRLNVIISRTLRETPEGAIVAKSFDEALEAVSSKEVKDRIENVFIIGGSSVYKMALDHPYCHRIFYTRVMEDFKCDTFLPEFDEDKFKKIEHPDIDGDVQTEKDIKFKFEVYEKVAHQ